MGRVCFCFGDVNHDSVTGARMCLRAAWLCDLGLVLVQLDAQRIARPQRERGDAFVAVGPHVVVVHLVHPHGRLVQDTCRKERTRELRVTHNPIPDVRSQVFWISLCTKSTPANTNYAYQYFFPQKNWFGPTLKHRYCSSALISTQGTYKSDAVTFQIMIVNYKIDLDVHSCTTFNLLFFSYLNIFVSQKSHFRRIFCNVSSYCFTVYCNVLQTFAHHWDYSQIHYIFFFLIFFTHQKWQK